MSGIAIYETPIRSEWIDYNGHLRDAYYGLIISHAADALMDRLGMDAAYRQRTGCTLYTVEMHLHFLREVKSADTAAVAVRVLGADRKRLHAAFDLARAGHSGLAATAEVMLLHVRQQGDAVVTAAFPPEVHAAIVALQAQSAGTTAAPGSRRMELPGTPRGP